MSFPLSIDFVRINHDEGGFVKLASVDHPAVPRVNDMVKFSTFEGVVTRVTWQWFTDQGPRAIVVLR